MVDMNDIDLCNEPILGGPNSYNSKDEVSRTDTMSVRGLFAFASQTSDLRQYENKKGDF